MEVPDHALLLEEILRREDPDRPRVRSEREEGAVGA